LANGTAPSLPSQNSPEPRGLLGILASAFSGVLFGWFFSKLKTPIQQSAESPHPQSHTDDSRTQTQPPLPIAVRIESYPPPTVSKEEQTERKWRNRREWGNLVATLFTALFAGGLLVITYVYAKYTYKMWQEMQTQTRTAQQQLEATQRPWIKIIDVVPTGNNPIVGGLSFQKIGPYKDAPDIRVQATIQVKLSFTNVGHSVAEVTPTMELFTPQFSTSEYWSRISTEEQRFCGSPDMRAVTAQKLTVFPGEQKPSEWDAGLSTPIRPENVNHLPDGAGITPALIICVSYRHEGLPSLYQTRALYEISHEGTGVRFFDTGPCNLHPFTNAPFTFCEGGMPAKMLRFSRDYNGDEAY
jgi:hypothetical protein